MGDRLSALGVGAGGGALGLLLAQALGMNFDFVWAIVGVFVLYLGWSVTVGWEA